ncbi:MAG: HAD-IIIC family phosphatase [Bryobacteraceae bacterium]|jgi:FkbH-like protein
MNDSVRIAPYNQVIQELLSPGSMFAANRGGINAILLRWEDFGEAAQLDRNAEELQRTILAAAPRFTSPIVVAVCPPSPRFARRHAEQVERLDLSFELSLSGSSANFISWKQILRWYPVANYSDAVADRLGHVPYTTEFFAALAASLVRRTDALRRAPFKVIALDCDNTLWRGVVGEDGPDGVAITPAFRALQEFMVRQHDAGMLIAICSKNNEADVEELFRVRSDMVLQRSHIATWRVNWDPKSENIRALAAELDLGMDSFIFIDDSAVECAEVAAHCPEVLTLQLPQDEDKIPGFLDNIWAFDHWGVTAEDRNRTQVYVQKLGRERLEREAADISDFIRSLELRVDIQPVRRETLARVSQLTQRTNQFNCTTIRRSETAIQQMLGERYECLTVSARDRFGDYGLVGATIFGSSGGRLKVDTFLLSCRALGRGVEHRVMSRLGEIALERGDSHVEVPLVPTAKNAPARGFLESIGDGYARQTESGVVFEFPAHYISKTSYQPGGVVSIPKEDKPSKPAVQTIAPVRDYVRIGAIRPGDEDRRIREQQAAAAGVYSGGENQPGGELEQRIAAIWAEALGLEAIGRNDNFFALGGTSLLSVQVLSRITREFANDNLTLSAMLEAPTVAEFGNLLLRGGTREYRSLVCMRTGDARPPFYCVHGGGGNVLSMRDLAMAMPEDLPFFCLQARGLDGSEPFRTVEETARYYVTEIRQMQPRGPYFIGGACYGGLVAFEMAREFARRGESVSVVLIDTYNHAYGKLLALHRLLYFNLRFVLQRIWYHLRRFRELDREQRAGFVSARVRSMTKHVAGMVALLTGRSKTQVVGDPPAGVPRGDSDAASFERAAYRVAEANLAAQRIYVPEPFDGSIMLFRARKRFVEPYRDSLLGWGPLVKRGVRVYEVPGDHNEITAEPHVRLLAQELDKYLLGR